MFRWKKSEIMFIVSVKRFWYVGRCTNMQDSLRQNQYFTCFLSHIMSKLWQKKSQICLDVQRFFKHRPDGILE